MGTGIEEHSPWALKVPLGPGTREEKVLLQVILEVASVCPYHPPLTKGDTKAQGGGGRTAAGTGLFQACCHGQLLIRSQAVTSGLQAPSQGCRAVSILLGLGPRCPPLPHCCWCVHTQRTCKLRVCVEEGLPGWNHGPARSSLWGALGTDQLAVSSSLSLGTLRTHREDNEGTQGPHGHLSPQCLPDPGLSPSICSCQPHQTLSSRHRRGSWGSGSDTPNETRRGRARE